ncbi:MAG: alpha/beta fold hydrolase [Solirubrobacteraceae bacterium]
MRLPELVLVHGAWHGSWAWERLLPVLGERGWSARTVDLPSSGSGASLSDDSELVAGILRRDDSPKVLVGHSYGGTVITQGGAGVESLVGLIYLCAAKPELGEVVWRDPRSPEEVPDWIRVDLEAQECHALRSETILYNDCPREVVSFAQARLKGQSLSSFLEPISGVAWRQRPSAYLICEMDNCVPAAAQEKLADGADHVERIAASHSPFLSRPGDVEAFLRRAVSTLQRAA